MKLFVLISNGGDGSYYPTYVVDERIIAKYKEKDEKGELDSEYDLGVDGDGFHYDTITVPDGSTEESLGITFTTFESLFDEEDDE